MGKLSYDVSQLKLYEICLSGFSGSAIAEIISLPLDTIKVQMQVYQGKYKNSMHCAKSIMETEGVKGLFKGLTAGLMRQLFFGTIRLAIFDVANGKLQQSKGLENITVFDRLLLALGAGAAAMVIANPTDVIKIRFQSDSSLNPRYKNFFHAGSTILKEEGVSGFYNSLGVNVLRNSVVCACELATYDQTKMYLVNNGYLKDGLLLHFLSSSNAGFVATCVSSPIDVVKSLYMNGKVINGKTVAWDSLLETVRHVISESGFKGFYKGFSANCQRVITWNIIMFIVREQCLLYFYNKRMGL